MCFVLLSVGAYFSVLSRFFQVFGIKVIIKSVFAKKSGAKKSDGITPLKALATALGGSIGTANIAGVASAIAIGGPGAIFWMWVSGILGMMTKYVEIALAMRTRQTASLWAALCIIWKADLVRSENPLPRRSRFSA